VAQANKITDAEERQKTLTLIDKNQTRQARIEKQQDNAIQENIIDTIIKGGGSTEDIPVKQWLQMPSKDRTFLESYVEKRDNGRLLDDIDSLVFFDGLSTSYAKRPESILDWSVPELAGFINDPAKLNKALEWRKEASTPGDSTKPKFDFTESQKTNLLQATHIDLKITGDSKAQQRAVLRQRLEEDIEAFKIEKKDTPSFTELTTLRDNLVTEIVFDPGWYRRNINKYKFELTGEEDLKTIEPTEEQADRIKARMLQEDPKAKPSEDQIRRIFIIEEGL